MLLTSLTTIVRQHLNWRAWEGAIRELGITIDRPRGSAHPDYPSIIYPIDYGYINGTMSSDGHEVDVFVGSAATGLVGTMITIDHRKGDVEFKLIHDCSPEEVYLVNGFINFDRRLMEGALALRYDMTSLWARVGL